MTARESLDAEMRAVLTQLHLTPTTPARGYGGQGVGSDEDPGGQRPPGDLGAHVYERWYGEPFHTCTPACDHTRPATTDDERREVLKAARAELIHLRGYDIRAARRENGRTIYEAVPIERPQVTGETLKELKARIVKEGEGWTVKEVAQRMRCGERIVRAARKHAGREPDFGRRPVSEADMDVRRARVRELRDRGLTPAQIARMLGVHRSTIERDLGIRAA